MLICLLSQTPKPFRTFICYTFIYYLNINKYYIFYVISKMNNRDISDQSYFESINSNKSVVT